MFDILAIGGATLDFFVESGKENILEMKSIEGKKEFFCLGYGDKIEIQKSSFDIGGGAVNTSVSFARLGLKTSLLVKTGAGHISGYLLSKVNSKNVDTSMVVHDKKQRTGFSIILTSFEGDRTVLTQRGANSTLTKDDIDWEALKSTKAIYCSALSNSSDLVLDDIAEFCDKNGVFFACNPGGTTIKKGLKGREKVVSAMNVIILNKHEASDFTGIAAKSETKYDEPNDSPIDPYVKEMLIKLKNFVKDIVLITDGKNGMYVYDGRSFFFAKPFPAKVVSTLGAGDAFASTFVGTLLKTGDVKKAIALASINSAGVV
ncbi:MAG: carbohydrate kinase family protein, partial [Candidatus Gastranaerophilales bacterium]|nr:carbohydrate kinase family protein [Candidatus Gastranaerophilales bacterium]